VKFQSKQDSIFLLTEAEDCDISRASYDIRLSSAEFLADDNVVGITVDRVAFHQIYDIAKTLLNTHGYVDNLENILAIIDQMSIGMRAKTHSKAPPQAKSLLPCITTKLPEKKRIGELLRRFYQEVEAYEAELAKLQGKPQQKNSTRDLNEKKFLFEMDRLKLENEELKQKMTTLSQEVNHLRSLRLQSDPSPASQDLLPPQIRTGKVREVDLFERSVAIKMGHKTVSTSLLHVHVIPTVDDPCLIYLDNGRVKSVYFYQSQGRSPRPEIAKVLFADGEVCKIRNQRREVSRIEARNEEEVLLLKSIKRGDRLLLFYIDTHLIRFDPIRELNEHHFCDLMQEAIAKQQLSEPYIEGLKLTIDETKEERIDEGA
jgi:hypothetical protein